MAASGTVRARREAAAQRRGGFVFLGGLAALLLLAAAINVNFGLPFNLSLWPPGQDYTLQANFKDANGLIKGADVVIAGHPVGQVTDVTADGSQARVTMRLSQQYTPVHKGTIARIRYSTLLAQKYVELQPVSGAETIKSGTTIPSTDTITPVDFDQFLSALDPQTRARLQTVIQQGGGSVEGRQGDIADLLDNLNGLSRESRGGLSTIQAHDGSLDGIIVNLSITSDRLDQSRQNLGELIQNANDVNATIDSQQLALLGLIHHLADLMADFNATLDGNEQNLHQTVVMLDPLVGRLNVTFDTLHGYMAPNLALFQQGISVLGTEGESAIHQRDANGNYLRQFAVFDSACDSLNNPRNPDCGNGANPDRKSSASPQPSSGSPSSPGAASPDSPTPSPSSSPSSSPTPSPAPSCDPLLALVGKC